MSYGVKGAGLLRHSAAVIAVLTVFPMALFPRLFALFLSAVLIVQIAASRTGHAAQSGTGKGTLIEDEGASGTGGHADGRTGGEMFFLGAAGGERKGKDGYGESRKYSVHVFLVVAGSCDAGIAGRAAVFCLCHPYTGARGNCHSVRHGLPFLFYQKAARAGAA